MMCTWQFVRETGAELGVEPTGALVVKSLRALPGVVVAVVIIVVVVVVVVGGGGDNGSISIGFRSGALIFGLKSGHVLVVVLCGIIREQCSVWHGWTVQEIMH